MAIHKFQPEVYHPALGTFPPVLEVSDGDTVVTTTVDNSGRDSEDRVVGHGPNPQTGPFFVSGAEPGDVLAVHFDSMWPNRAVGRSSSTIAVGILDPSYEKGRTKESRQVEWELDLKQGIASLVTSAGELRPLTIPLAPMLGCFGVAPPKGKSISSTTSSTHGGNMDYRGFGAGATVYFPVSAPGGLFFLGDGHAVQGHGEIIGTGIEVSFDVQLTVKVLKRRSIEWPRAEDDEYIMTVGNDRPLEKALRHATTEMARWLEDYFNMDERTTNILLGMCLEYEVGNIFDPAYTMIAKISKRLLPDDMSAFAGR